jgi:hypothetical protein
MLYVFHSSQSTHVTTVHKTHESPSPRELAAPAAPAGGAGARGARPRAAPRGPARPQRRACDARVWPLAARMNAAGRRHDKKVQKKGEREQESKAPAVCALCAITHGNLHVNHPPCPPPHTTQPRTSVHCVHTTESPPSPTTHTQVTRHKTLHAVPLVPHASRSPVLLSIRRQVGADSAAETRPSCRGCRLKVRHVRDAGGAPRTGRRSVPA